jgi:hypothetical protein
MHIGPGTDPGQGRKDGNLNIIHPGGRLESQEAARDLVKTLCVAAFSRELGDWRRWRKVSMLENLQG